MRNSIKKVICAALCVGVASGLVLASGCSDYRNSIKLSGDYSSGEVSSNGGFVVEKGNYVYFVNGVGDYEDDNTYGDVVKGAIMRISKTDLAAHSYSSAETVVPQIYYSGNYDSGIYIYGDYIYYSTPATDRNSDGEVQNSYLDFKSTRLDGSESMKSYYYQASTNSFEYRYVEVNGTVYLLYAVSESLYGTSTTNIHSVNTKTYEDVLLAYNVSAYSFDEGDSESPYVYYTMAVTANIGGDNENTRSYNQIYRVRADQTEQNEYDFSYIEDYDADEDPVYVNCGTLVFDGIGAYDASNANIGLYMPTQFNARGETGDYSDITHSDYTYSITKYENGKLYYTRTASAEMLFTVTDDEVDATGFDPITSNPDYTDAYLIDADSAEDYEFVTVNNKDMVLYVNGTCFMMGEIVDGEVVNEYRITDDGDDASPEFMFISGSYLYYSLEGENDNYICRVDYTGDHDDYNLLPTDPDDYTDYDSVQILDIEYYSSWFMPELVEGQLLFASATDQMGSYNYIMACDISGTCDDGVMENKDIQALNDKYDGVLEDIEDVDADVYENLPDALTYLFYTGDVDYLADLINAYVEIENRNEEYLYSKESAQIYKDYAAAAAGDIDWSSYAADTRTINGETVCANMRSYYYTVIGKMTDDDYDEYIEALRSEYFSDYPEEEETTWWEGLNTAAKVCFIVGMCVAGLLIIAGATVLIIVLVKRGKRKNQEAVEEKPVVDITDDKSIDVYGEAHTESLTPESAEAPESTAEGEPAESAESEKGEE